MSKRKVMYVKVWKHEPVKFINWNIAVVNGNSTIMQNN